MICLTSDIHHMSLNTGNQQHSDRSEINIAREFVEMLEDYNVKASFFITGRSFEEEWPDLQPICESNLLEIGGHTYDCFTPELWHRIWNKLVGSYNGPRWYQDRDIQKTKDIIHQKCGINISSWRNHMYMHGPYTDELLVKHGIRICCDGVQRRSNGPTIYQSGLENFPLNIIPDHEHLYHAERTPDWVDKWVKRYNWSDDYGSQSYYINEWVDIVLEELEYREKNDIVSHLLIHPITLYLCDGFKSLERIVQYIATKQSTHVSDMVFPIASTNVKPTENVFSNRSYLSDA